jgi:hemoglobin
VSDGGQVLPYELIGGEAALRRLVDRFYEIMDTDPRAATIRAMHAADLGPIRERLFEFLSGWLGGPPLYSQRTGSVCITQAHQPFAIGPAERDQWVMCMRQALIDVEIQPDVREMLDQAFQMIADFVRNRD